MNALATTAFVVLAVVAVPPKKILGTWRGTSICVDHAKDPACRDEVVVYDIDSLVGTDSVLFKADKIVGGKRQPMGEMHFGYDPKGTTWSCELKTRVHALWSFQPGDSVMRGTLVELPSHRLVRRVLVKRSTRAQP
jgi:hypothetical protein